jgi:hypothetical protein
MEARKHFDTDEYHSFLFMFNLAASTTTAPFTFYINQVYYIEN